MTHHPLALSLSLSCSFSSASWSKHKLIWKDNGNMRLRLKVQENTFNTDALIGLVIGPENIKRAPFYGHITWWKSVQGACSVVCGSHRGDVWSVIAAVRPDLIETPERASLWIALTQPVISVQRAIAMLILHGSGKSIICGNECSGKRWKDGINHW